MENEINCIVSLGEGCTIACFLKKNNLRQQAFPFDYIVSGLTGISNLLETDFKDFFNVELIECIHPNADASGSGSNTIFQHNIYRDIQFPHHNLNDNEIKVAFKRRIDRLMKLIKSNLNILFIHIHCSKYINVDRFVSAIYKINPKCKFTLAIIYYCIHSNESFHLKKITNNIKEYEVTAPNIWLGSEYIAKIIQDYKIIPKEYDNAELFYNSGLSTYS